MNQARKKLTAFGVTALIVLLLDQLSKYWIRTTPDLHHYTIIEGWFAFNFTKNPGMALGIHWADTWVISLIAIFATVIILIYVMKTMKSANLGYMVCMGLIVGGALGNISDRFFMAIVGGYGGVLDGHVVDFLHFKLRIGEFDVFPYIFNVADSAITVAIITLIVFYKKLMPDIAGEKPVVDNRADDNKAGAGETGADKTGAGETGADKTDADKTGADKTGADKTDADKTGAGETGADKTDADKTGAG